MQVRVEVVLFSIVRYFHEGFIFIFTVDLVKTVQNNTDESFFSKSLNIFVPECWLLDFPNTENWQVIYHLVPISTLLFIVFNLTASLAALNNVIVNSQPPRYCSALKAV